MRRFIRNYARFGIASLALLYLMTGGLTALAALGFGGEASDQKSIFPFLIRLPLGKPFVWSMIVGLGGYVQWRLLQAWKNPKGLGMGPVDLMIRTGYLISAFLYGGLGFYAARLLARGWAPRRDNAAELATELLRHPQGRWLMWTAALILSIAAITQFVRAFTGKFANAINDEGAKRRHAALIRVSGLIGFTARGIVLLVTAYLFWKAGLHWNASEAGGTERTWAFLAAEPHGSWLLATVASGLAAYGLFLAVQAWSLQDDLIG
jgi:hypothetical protein